MAETPQDDIVGMEQYNTLPRRIVRSRSRGTSVGARAPGISTAPTRRSARATASCTVPALLARVCTRPAMPKCMSR